MPLPAGEPKSGTQCYEACKGHLVRTNRCKLLSRLRIQGRHSPSPDIATGLHRIRKCCFAASHPSGLSRSVASASAANSAWSQEDQHREIARADEVRRRWLAAADSQLDPSATLAPDRQSNHTSEERPTRPDDRVASASDSSLTQHASLLEATTLSAPQPEVTVTVHGLTDEEEGKQTSHCGTTTGGSTPVYSRTASSRRLSPRLTAGSLPSIVCFGGRAQSQRRCSS